MEEMNSLAAKIETDYENSSYQKGKGVSNEHDLKKNMDYLSYHLQNPKTYTEIAYSILASQTY